MNNKLWILPGYVSWPTIVLAFLAIITFFAVSNPSVQYATRMGYGGGMVEDSGTMAVPPSGGGAPMMGSGVTNGMMSPDYYPYPYPSQDVPITDTREYLKIYYNATMLTRDVQGLTRRVETTVRGFDGRIDNESSAEKYGYISFALPQAKYDAFRDELESLVDSRFIKISISSQNMLAQKVSIEEQKKQADKALADYRASRQQLISAHESARQALQERIDASTSDTEKAALQTQLAKENSAYTRNLANADANIKYAQDWVKGVATQDATLLANVATVSGTVSISWISLWDMALLYLPGYWIPTIFAMLALLSYLRDRARVRKY